MGDESGEQSGCLPGSVTVVLLVVLLVPEYCAVLLVLVAAPRQSPADAMYRVHS